jgi:hypothetical protein
MSEQPQTDCEFAVWIDQCCAEMNQHDAPLNAQYWTAEMVIEMYVSSTIDLHEDEGTPDAAFTAEVFGEEMRVLIYEEGNAPPPLAPEQAQRLEAAIQEAKERYWRGKLEGRLS